LAKLGLHRKVPLVRGIYARLDQARLEREELSAQLAQAQQDRDRFAAQLDRWRYALSRPYLTDPDNAVWPATPTGETQGEAADDEKIVDRIRAAYKLALTAAAPASGSFWEQSFFAQKRDVHEALIERDPTNARWLLCDPRKSDLLFGFDALAKSILHWRGDGVHVYLDLVALAQAISARRLWNPESLGGNPDYVDAFPEVDPLLKMIDERIGFRITFPNPFPGEKGLSTPRGIASLRAVQALYQAWRIAGLVQRKDSAVLEIGAGTGRTAFYANQLGITNYTIVDLPMTNVAQANFLIRSLSEDKVSVYGETNSRSRIRVLPPTSFFGSDDKYDLAVNVDSLTEMARDTAFAYCSEIKNRAQRFLSINHEHNDFTAREVCEDAGLPKGNRHPYWLRRGYVEELFDLT
jgi:hypothetical protein